jgi:hypothetical protein
MCHMRRRIHIPAADIIEPMRQLMSHMRRMIHVSHEEEDTRVWSYRRPTSSNPCVNSCPITAPTEP